MKQVVRWSMFALLVFAGWFTGSQFYRALSFPQHIRLLPGESFTVKLGPFLYADAIQQDGWTATSEQGTATVRAEQIGTGGLEFSLLGIPVRRTEIDVVPRLHLVPGGHSVGILMGHGVRITEVTSPESAYSGESSITLQPGDVIIQAGNEKITHGSQLESVVQRYGEQGLPVPIKAIRDNREFTVHIRPQFVSRGGRGHYMLGIWVQENAAGVGTLTFWDPNTGRYGALGHKISTPGEEHFTGGGTIGRLVEARIQGIVPGTRGRPGEKSGVFASQAATMGTIDKNTSYGIYGNLTGSLPGNKQTLPVALGYEIERGPATILTVIDGNRIEEFDVQITHVNRQSRPNDKGLQLRVTDPRLLQHTNGIVQGMSGSPIIQNGRIVGAVTHVFVSDPQRGYGILAEWMVYEAGLNMEIRDESTAKAG